MPKCHALVWNGLKFELCNAPTEHIHHIIPEKWQLLHMHTEPEDSVALGLCKKHHVGIGRGKFGSWDFSMHPDYGYALEHWTERPELMKQVHDRHVELALKGIVYWNNEGDKAYLEMATVVQERWLKKHPELPKPKTKICRDQSGTENYNGKLTTTTEVNSTTSTYSKQEIQLPAQSSSPSPQPKETP